MNKEEAIIALEKLYEEDETYYDKTTWDGIFHLNFLSDALKIAIEALKEPKPGWISVKDRLPSEGKRVLVFIPFRGTSLFYVSYLETEKWYVPDRLGRFELNDVTHWMPLPEPPTSE